MSSYAKSLRASVKNSRTSEVTEDLFRWWCENREKRRSAFLNTWRRLRSTAQCLYSLPVRCYLYEGACYCPGAEVVRLFFVLLKTFLGILILSSFHGNSRGSLFII